MLRGNDAKCPSNPTAVEKYHTGPAAAKPPPLRVLAEHRAPHRTATLTTTQTSAKGPYSRQIRLFLAAYNDPIPIGPEGVRESPGAWVTVPNSILAPCPSTPQEAN
jgi:hypothetical protein